VSSKFLAGGLLTGPLLCAFGLFSFLLFFLGPGFPLIFLLISRFLLDFLKILIIIDDNAYL
jgi:hypothetical protein